MTPQVQPAIATADMLSLLRLLALHWKLSVSLALIGAVGGLAASWTQPKQYRVEATLMVSEDQGGLEASLSRQIELPAFAALALPFQSDEQKTLAMATARSHEFARVFVEENGLLPVLLPSSGFMSGEPTLNRATRKFRRQVFQVSEDRRTGTVTFAIKWVDNDKAALWLSTLIARLNEMLRERAKQEAEANLRYLQAELASTAVVGNREMLFRLIESQTRVAMLANTRAEYAFKLIDPPRTPDPDEHVSPKRWLFASLGLLLGALLGTVWTLARLAR